MRVFLDTKSDELRVELTQAAVAKTYSGGKPGEAVIEIDVAKGGEVIALRVKPLSDLLEELNPKTIAPQA